MTRWRLSLWALAAAAALCAPYALSGAFRHAWQAHYPAEASAWANDGRATLLGLYGTENQGDELVYAARVREASERLLPYDPFILENRSRRVLAADGLSYHAMGLVLRAVGDINRAWLLVRVLCALLWFWLVRRLALALGAAEPLALFCAVFVVTFSYALTLCGVWMLDLSGPPLKALARGAWTLLSAGRTEGLQRLPRPGVTYVVLFLAALLWTRAAESSRRRWALAAGLFAGLTPYFRLDVGSTVLLGAALFTLAHARTRLLKPLAAGLVLAALVALPYALVNYPPDPELVMRSKGSFGRQLYPLSLPYLLGALAAWRWAKRPAQTLLGCLLAAVFLIQNSQLLTGVSIGWDHWSYFANVLLFLLLLSWLPRRWAESRAWLPAAGLCCVLAFIQGVGYAAIHYPFQGLPKEHDAALRWLEREAPLDSVVLSLDPEVNLLVPAFTPSKVGFSETVAHISDLPLLESTRRVQEGLRLLGADSRRFKKDCVDPYFFPDRRLMDTRSFPACRLVKTFYFHETLDDRVQALWAEAAAKPLEKPYRVDFVWIGPFERQFIGKGFPASGKLPLEKAFETGAGERAITLYRVRRS
ncbi:MAG: hypothetical protein WC969_03840 [Elusimicrobiota bacterium]|jgi:hypothetical protein